MKIDAPIPTTHLLPLAPEERAVLRGNTLLADINTGVATLVFSGNPEGADVPPGWAASFLHPDYIARQQVKAAIADALTFGSWEDLAEHLGAELVFSDVPHQGWFPPRTRHLVVEPGQFGKGVHMSLWHGCRCVERWDSYEVDGWIVLAPYAVRV